jgi:hypothetical protein
MSTDKRLMSFLLSAGAEGVSHTGKTYLGHLVNVWNLMQAQGCSEELCRAGMFHSIYGTELFQGFKLPLERRADVRAVIGERAERLAWLNCVMDRAAFDRAIAGGTEPFLFRDRVTGAEFPLTRDDFDDLCRVHLFDRLEQVPRSRHGWGYRRAAYRAMAERLGGTALATYDRVFATEPASREEAAR